MKRKILYFTIMVCLLVSILGIQASASNMPPNTPEIELQNAKIKSTKTYTEKNIDKDGVEWTDIVTEYNVSVPLKSDSTKQIANINTVNSAELPYIDAKVQSVVGTNGARTYIRYYGRCYTTMPVSTKMSMALLWYTGSTYIEEATQPLYISYGTAVATPIYLFPSPTTGYWKSRNIFLCEAPDFTTAEGKAYSGDLYIEPY